MRFKNFYMLEDEEKKGHYFSTLNSSITEIIPLILFNNKKLRSIRNNNDIIEKILKMDIKSMPIFLNGQDAKTGLGYLKNAIESKKFDEKMQNAKAIYDFLINLNETKKIKKTWWTYRAKPKGVSNSSPADIVIEFKDGEMLGISLKAGLDNTKEPYLNTYVSKVKKYFNSNLVKVKEKLWKEVFKKIGTIKKREYTSGKFKKHLTLFEKENPTEYNKLYNEALSIVKKSITKDFKNTEKMKDWIKEKVLKDNALPVKIIKAYGSKWKELTDKDKITDDLAILNGILIKDINKQTFEVILQINKKRNLKLLFDIRTNRSKGMNKLHQVPNLAIKYNGLK